MFSISSQQSKYLTMSAAFFTGLTSGLTIGYFLCKGKHSTPIPIVTPISSKPKIDCENGVCSIQFVNDIIDKVDQIHTPEQNQSEQ
jgi:hypothetical protein